MSYAIYPITNWDTVTPSDTVKLDFKGAIPKRCRAIIVGGAGNVAVVNEDGSSTILTGLLAGGQYAVSTDQILATGTTATDIAAGFDSSVTS